MFRNDFISLLGDQLNTRLTILRTFANSCLPHLNTYSLNFKEKIGYSLILTEYKRGDVIISKDVNYRELCFVFEGEAAVSIEENSKFKNVVKIGAGMCFAEECALLGKPSLFTIRISSERAIIAKIQQADIAHLPDETIEALKKNLQDKIKSRTILLSPTKRYTNNFSENNSPKFVSANRQAREKLMTYILRNRPSTPKRILNLSRIKNQKFKDKLQDLRDCSPRRLRMSPIVYSNRGSTSRRNKSKSSYPFKDLRIL